LNNGNTPGIGVSPLETTSFNGTRHGAYVSYIQNAPPNLTPITHVRVNRILFNSNNEVTGVELVFWNYTTGKGYSNTCTVNTNVVVVSAGAIGTAKLLKLSGVGPASELEPLGITVVSDLSEVGYNLADHYGVDVLTTNVSGSLPFDPSMPSATAQMFWNINDDPNATPNFDINLVITMLAPPELEAFWSVNILNGTFRGNVTLRSANPDDDPLYNPNFLGTDVDKEVMAKSLNLDLQLINATGGQILISDPCNATNCNTDLQRLNTYLLAAPNGAGYHVSGTAAIGKVTSPNSLKVYGTHGLYVSDTSVFPYTPCANTQSTTYAVSERGIKLIIRHAKKKGLL